jgi:hypothetical protein
MGNRELSQRFARDDLAARLIMAGRQRAIIDPPPYGVVTDSEQVGGITDPDHRHGGILTAFSG